MLNTKSTITDYKNQLKGTSRAESQKSPLEKLRLEIS